MPFESSLQRSPSRLGDEKETDRKEHRSLRGTAGSLIDELYKISRSEILQAMHAISHT